MHVNNISENIAYYISSVFTGQAVVESTNIKNKSIKNTVVKAVEICRVWTTLRQERQLFIMHKINNSMTTINK